MPAPSEDDSNAPTPNSKFSKTRPKLSPRHRFSQISLEDPDLISPLILGRSKDVDDFNLDRPPRPPSVRLSHQTSRRLSRMSSKESLRRIYSAGDSRTALNLDGQSFTTDSFARHARALQSVFEDIAAWVREEKAKQSSDEPRHTNSLTSSRNLDLFASTYQPRRMQSDKIKDEVPLSSRASNDGVGDSVPSLALDKLEDIVARGLRLLAGDKLPVRKPSKRFLRHSQRSMTMSSETEAPDDDPTSVPSCDAILDNSKTTIYYGSLTGSSASLLENKTTNKAEDDPWSKFKHDIVKLTHSLKLKRWRQVSLSESKDIEVERLSGALTNAVYVVSPPRYMQDLGSKIAEDKHGKKPRKKPRKLLLRIYGPQVEHLIDRDAELNILHRLGRKNIGPKLLGTFRNGRFEEYFYAMALKPADLRVPETSRQIAMRMRELHDGIELLHEERKAGPFIWTNWDKWLGRVERVVNFLDHQVLADDVIPAVAESIKKRGLICGTPWAIFRRAVEQYRDWLQTQYGGLKQLQEHLVFAHNDTQYGNILRVEPPGESPLLHPANVHRQLVVIDFEYANANVPGLEFANHFTEWCYDYGSAERPYACHTSRYPTPQEQYRFVRQYVTHRPRYAPAATATPKLHPSTPLLAPRKGISDIVSSLSSLSKEHMPKHGGSESHPDYNTSLTETEIHNEAIRLMQETRLWRLANSAQWVAWGIVQAHVPGLEEYEKAGNAMSSGELERIASHKSLQDGQASDVLGPEAKANAEDLNNKRPEEDADDEAFDYLGYARDRAMFFWGDCLQLGFITMAELPPDVRELVRVVDY